MQLKDLQPKTKRKKSKRIGRGGKRGTYSGRGIKGQKARAGRRIRPAIRDIIKKIPKKRGYKFKPIRDKTEIVSLSVLQNKFKDGEKINPLKLIKAGVVFLRGKKTPRIKILGKNQISKKFFIYKCEISDSAKKEIIKAGGEVK